MKDINHISLIEVLICRISGTILVLIVILIIPAIIVITVKILKDGKVKEKKILRV